MVEIGKANVIYRGKLFNEAINQASTPSQAPLNRLLGSFFARGNTNIYTIRQVLDPYLAICGSMYKDSFQSGLNLSFTSNSFSEIPRVYNSASGVPQCLDELKRIGLINNEIAKSKEVWRCKNELLNKLGMENELIDPVRALLD